MDAVPAPVAAPRFLLGTVDTAQDSSARPRRTGGAGRVEYLELDLLWGDRGPVARLLLENTAAAMVVEQVRLFAQQGGGRRLIGTARILVPAGKRLTALVDLDRDFPSAAAWLQHGDARPIRVWAGPAVADPRIAADTRP